ncbi:MAG: putative transposase, partial [Gammaproteobacteria bacterium]
PLPKHYVARERLCLRATIDYWVNALDGQPFFVVNQAVDPGLLRVLENEIVPHLEKEVPAQPSAEQLAADPWRHRFTRVFDREGCSPGFFLRMKQKHIACLTYHKYRLLYELVSSQNP